MTSIWFSWLHLQSNFSDLKICQNAYWTICAFPIYQLIKAAVLYTQSYIVHYSMTSKSITFITWTVEFEWNKRASSNLGIATFSIKPIWINTHLLSITCIVSNSIFTVISEEQGQQELGGQCWILNCIRHRHVFVPRQGILCYNELPVLSFD